MRCWCRFCCTRPDEQTWAGHQLLRDSRYNWIKWLFHTKTSKATMPQRDWKQCRERPGSSCKIMHSSHPTHSVCLRKTQGGKEKSICFVPYLILVKMRERTMNSFAAHDFVVSGHNSKAAKKHDAGENLCHHQIPSKHATIQSMNYFPCGIQ